MLTPKTLFLLADWGFSEHSMSHGTKVPLPQKEDHPRVFLIRMRSPQGNSYSRHQGVPFPKGPFLEGSVSSLGWIFALLPGWAHQGKNDRFSFD